MGTGMFLVPIFVVLGIVSAVLLAWKKPPREGIGRFWWLLFGSAIAVAGYDFMAYILFIGHGGRRPRPGAMTWTEALLQKPSSLVLFVFGAAVLLAGLVIAVLAFCPSKPQCERET